MMCKLQIDVDAIEQLATNKELVDKLADPNLDESEKQEMLNTVAVTVMKELGYTPNETKVVSTDEPGRDGESVKGHYNEGTNTNYINDKNNNSTNELVATTGHEIIHAMDKQEGTFKAGDADQNTYANNFGADLSFYTGAALDYTHSTSMADTNNHTQLKSLEAYLQLQQNNQEFKNVDKQEGDNRQLPNFQLPNDILTGVNGLTEWLFGTSKGATEQVATPVNNELDRINSHSVVGPIANGLARDVPVALEGGLDGYREVRDNSPIVPRTMLKAGMTAVEMGLLVR